MNTYQSPNPFYTGTLLLHYSQTTLLTKPRLYPLKPSPPPLARRGQSSIYNKAPQRKIRDQSDRPRRTHIPHIFPKQRAIHLCDQGMRCISYGQQRLRGRWRCNSHTNLVPIQRVIERYCVEKLTIEREVESRKYTKYSFARNIVEVICVRCKVPFFRFIRKQISVMWSL